MLYTVNECRFNVVEVGIGPKTAIFLHYYAGSVKAWQTVMEMLSDGYRCIAIDLRGHGDSEAPAQGYSIENMANDVELLLPLLNVQDFVLVGHSMGGKVAMELASRQPAGLQTLLLLSPSPPLPEPIPDDERQQMLENHDEKAAEETFEKITAKAVSDEIKAQIIADNLRTSDVAWKAWLTLGSKEVISNQTLAITVPVHILAGTADKAVAPNVQPDMTLPYLKNATFDTIDGVGHLQPYEAPAEVVAFILEHTSE